MNLQNISGKWTYAKELLINPGLKDSEHYEEPEGTVDVLSVDDSGQSALAIQLLSRIKLVWIT